MTSWKRVRKLFRIMMRRIGNPPIKLVTPKRWDKLFPEYKLGDAYGRCSIEDKIITCRYKDIHSTFQINDTILHEALHILFRYKPHWWIESVALKFMYIYIRSNSTKKSYHILNDVPQHRRLKYLIRCTSERMRQKL